MSFFSWMRRTRRSGESADPVQRTFTCTAYIAVEPSEIANLVIQLNSEYARANELCSEADTVIKRQVHELAFLRERNTHLKSSNRNLKALNATIVLRNSSVNQKAAQLSQAQHTLRLEQEKVKALRVEILESRMEVRIAEYGDLYDGKIAILSFRVLFTLPTC